MTRTDDNVSIHRALDAAFAAAPAGAEAQDLKEEVRASLLARAAALEATGLSEAEAARTALAELGDLRDVVATVAVAGEDSGHAALVAAHRVRPRPAFVLRVTAAALAAAGAAAAVLVAVGALERPVGFGAGFVLLGALAVAVIVTDALRQETTTNYPLPTGRATAFGAAAGGAVVALGFGGLFATQVGEVWLVLLAAAAAVGSVTGFVVLGVTQTNRHKPWTLELGRRVAVEDRFAQEPAEAARFGIYTVVLWTVALIAFVVLTILVGLVWSWLALALAVPAFLLLVARMVFPARR